MTLKPEERLFELFAMTAPGLEQACAAELDTLGMASIRVLSGGVEFRGPLRDLYRANLWLRIASRVLVRVGECRSRDFPSLYRQAGQMPWGRFIRPGTPLTVRVTSRRSRLTHTGRITATVEEAISRALGRMDPNLQGEEQLVLARVEDDRAHFSVDSSGALLHRRGYRTGRALAPLRETLAAGILRLLEWDRSTPLIDPMCGSGTFPIEAQLWARDIPPGRWRKFAFMNWPRFRPGLWQALLIEADRSVRPEPVAVRGMDRDPNAVAAAIAHAERSGVAPFITLLNQDFEKIETCDRSGLIVCNPPYGRRLGRDEDLPSMYRSFGSVCRKKMAGWRVGFLSPGEDLARVTGLPVRQIARLRNGGIAVGLYRADLPVAP